MARFKWILKHFTRWILTPFIQLVFLQFTTVLGQIQYYGMTVAPPLPKFKPTAKNITHMRGDTAILRCSVENLGTKYVVWRKATDPNPLTVANEVYVEDPDFVIKHKPNTGDWDLHIYNVQPRHAGVYECQISSKHQLIHLIMLRVIDKPITPPEIMISGTSFVDKGIPIRLTCNATGLSHLHPDIDWFKDGQKINSNAMKKVFIKKGTSLSQGTIVSTLEISHSRLIDAGTYICRTSEEQVTSIKVNVLDADSNNVKRGTAHSGNGQGSYRQAVTFTLVLTFGLSTCQFIIQ